MIAVTVADTHSLSHGRTIAAKNLYAWAKRARKRSPWNVASVHQGVAMALCTNYGETGIPGDLFATLRENYKATIAIDNEQPVVRIAQQIGQRELASFAN